MKQYSEGSGNVFRDLNCKNPEEKLAKAKLAFIINQLIAEKGLTQKEAAQILGIDQPKVSALKNGKLSRFSLERLFSFLAALDQHIEIVVRHKKAKDVLEEMIEVAYA